MNFDSTNALVALKHNLPFVQKMSNISLKNDTLQTESFPNLFNEVEIGQWVDAKDTINQWLEAQVIDIKDGKALIHYNGWDIRWNEWIDVNSSRLSPFRTHTIQYPSTQFLEPFPNIKADGNIPEASMTIEEAIKSLENVHKSIGGTLSNFVSLLQSTSVQEEPEKRMLEDLDYEEEKKESQTIKHKKSTNVLYQKSGQLASLFDRYGRIMIDAAPLLAHYGKPEIVVNNKIKREKMMEEGDICMNVPIMPSPLDLKPLGNLIERPNRGDITMIHTYIDRTGVIPTVELGIQTEYRIYIAIMMIQTVKSQMKDPKQSIT